MGLAHYKKHGTPISGKKWSDSAEKPESEEETRRKQNEQWKTAHDLFVEYVKNGDPDIAVNVFEQSCKSNGRRPMSDNDLLILIQSFIKKNMHKEAQPYMREYLTRDPGHIGVNLQLCNAYILNEQPQSALGVLKAIQTENLTKQQFKQLNALKHKADAMAQEGILELE